MKLRFFYILFFCGFVYVLNSGLSTGAAASLNDGYTGAPGEHPGCFATGCHVDSDPFGTSVTIDVQDQVSGNSVTGYVPGGLYNVIVTIEVSSVPQGYGFQMVCLNDADNSDTQGWSNPGTDTQISMASMTGRSYAEQDKLSTNNVFMVQWTAPGFSSSTGSVTFYASGNAVNGNSMFSGDDPGTASLTLAEQTSSGLAETDRLTMHMGYYPNPANELLNINFTGTLSGNYDLDIFDELGRKIACESLNLIRGNNAHIIDLCDFLPGTYTLRVHQNGKFKTGRFVKL